MRILIVEDEKHLAEGLKFNLETEGYEAEIAEDGEIAFRRLSEENFDAVVLDVMLPKIDGFTLAARLRQSENFVPILMLTALGKSEDVLKGFASGADDYLPKPFDLSIFLARLKGLLRRREWLKREMSRTSEIVTVNGRTIDFDSLEIRHENKVVRLTLMEAKFLRYLIENEGKVVSRKMILEEVWGLCEDTDTRAIDNFIVRLRKYLEDEPNKPKFLQTVRGVGYRFVNEG
ncbi:MAG: response regulator transcription factor [Pyrinomonadaceae bacterium]|nr:response regulator transcription factor [Pyrinomonadaceae bacterium]MCX7639184.1 response regulator transcription factor [Pyrinomonadaceae bacterium]MDW8303595.1 response regulator transcription factor [Acidobacteriota bacterium]